MAPLVDEVGTGTVLAADVAGVGDGAGGDGLGAVQLPDDGDEVDGSGNDDNGGVPPAMNDRLKSASALTFSIRCSYRHSITRLEEFLTKPWSASADDGAAVA